MRVNREARRLRRRSRKRSPDKNQKNLRPSNSPKDESARAVSGAKKPSFTVVGLRHLLRKSGSSLSDQSSMEFEVAWKSRCRAPRGDNNAFASEADYRSRSTKDGRDSGGVSPRNSGGHSDLDEFRDEDKGPASKTEWSWSAFNS